MVVCGGVGGIRVGDRVVVIGVWWCVVQLLAWSAMVSEMQRSGVFIIDCSSGRFNSEARPREERRDTSGVPRRPEETKKSVLVKPAQPLTILGIREPQNGHFGARLGK